jgi:hypothetical protein
MASWDVDDVAAYIEKNYSKAVADKFCGECYYVCVYLL